MSLTSDRVYQIVVDYACFGIVTNSKGKVVQAAPIAKWAKGKDINEVLKYYITKKNAQITYVDPTEKVQSRPDDIKIVIHPKDDFGEDADNKYCCVVMGWSDKSKGWYNTGLVFREDSVELAVSKAIQRATEKGWWS